ncbi:slightly ste11-like protein [Kalmusia sp. IMI 367209]|nr:slightly ste11-like protein [Kalmusia sp. IMI 367209]
MQLGENVSSHSLAEDVKSPRSSKRGSRFYELRSAPTSSSAENISKDDVASPASSSSSPKWRRKREAPINDDFNGVESVHGDSPTDPRAPPNTSPAGSGEHVCLCQPEPKIPRPRNAFILYRQHHQHAIVAANPGLPNPDISKIIGEQWKAESNDAKKIWQDLAQEEKDRHHEQYPDYRYQPRRLGKPLNSAVQHTTVEKYRCPRCGGRSIKTPTSPYPGSVIPPTLPLPNISTSLSPTIRLPPIMSNLSLESPARRRGPVGPSSLSNIQIPPSIREDGYSYTPLTPETKRRRFNGNYPTTTNGRRLDTPYYNPALDRRGSLPPLQMRNSPPQTATMPPPRTPRDARRGSVDLNVLVPSQNDQSRSVEAMVMSVPYTVKIKVLGRITPPLKEPGPTSPAVQVRGGIIAVEGEDQAAVTELTLWLKDFLSKDKDYSPRLADPPKQPEGKGESSFEEYFDLIREWHGKSKEMIKFITTAVAPPSSPHSPSSEKDEAMKEGSTTPPASPVPCPKPVLILPTYQLHASDLYASRIPIQDVYSPMDHWQWMATLWRGTVGPDLTIYIKDADKDREGRDGGKLVEINDEVRCLTLTKGGQGTFAEAALRRVGFEVGEWIRGLGGSKTS